MPGTFQSTVDAMFKENGLPKFNFPQQIITKEFKNLLQQTTNDLDEEINQVNEEMETEIVEQSNKRAREIGSPEAPKKKRGIATTSMATSSSNGSIAL